MIRKKYFILLLLLTFLSLSGANQTAAKSVEFPENDSYSDEVTGIVFPAEINGFCKKMVRIHNRLPICGTTIYYYGKNFNGLADIYIYALQEDPKVISDSEFTDHIVSVRKNILKTDPNMKKSHRMESSYQARYVKNGKLTAYLEHFSCELDSNSFLSYLLIFPYGDRIVKVRITVPEESPDSIIQSDRFIKTICRLFFNKNMPVFVPVKKAEESSEQ